MSSREGVAGTAAGGGASPVDHALRYNAEVVRALSTCQGRHAQFINKRLSEDFAMPQRLMDCKSPMEVIDVWADFYRTAMEHYFDHAKQLTEQGTDALEEFVREAEAEAEDLAQATNKAMKSVADAANDGAGKSGDGSGKAEAA